MSLLRLEDRQNIFEMGVAIEEDSKLQSYGDAYVTLKVKSNDFVGQNDLWVLGSAMQTFCQQLSQLHKALKGEALLTGISPGELLVRVRSVSSLGHIAVEGTTGYHIHGSHSLYFHSISFGFEFDQEQHLAAISLPWVQRYASENVG